MVHIPINEVHVLESEIIELKQLEKEETITRSPYTTLGIVATAATAEIAGVLQGDTRLIWTAVGLGLVSLVTLRAETRISTS